ncbi:MAG: methyltransferase type 11 [Latescibacteria bacterium DG_63]|nr:MAG: methyltransferase type 11 [Latescibacteria bacterium DG_63]
MEKSSGSARRETPDVDRYIRDLTLTNPLAEPIVTSAIKSLELPLGSRGLDAGCGIGLQALLLAQAVGSTGHVTGLDISRGLLARAEGIVKAAGLSEQILFQEGDVRELPFDENTFDWAWSSNCVGYAPMEPVPLVKELARVVRPGGQVAVFAWSSEQLLPGYPLLEARLKATSSGIAPFSEGKNPRSHFLRALSWLSDVGLGECEARTFTGDVQAPLSDALREAMTALFKMRWVGVQSELSDEDRAEYERLCQPESPDFILNAPDYYGFFTCSLFCGKVTK